MSPFCHTKIDGKTVFNEEITVIKCEKKINHMLKMVFIILNGVKLWVRLKYFPFLSMFSEFTFGEEDS